MGVLAYSTYLMLGRFADVRRLQQLVTRLLGVQSVTAALRSNCANAYRSCSTEYSASTMARTEVQLALSAFGFELNRDLTHHHGMGQDGAGPGAALI